MDREEIVSELIASYREELAQLTDQELLRHWKLQKGISQMSDKEWAEIYKSVGRK